VPFASVTGTKRLLDIDPTSHGATATPRVQVLFNRPAFGRAEKSWEDLAGLVTNFTPFLEIATRVMHGLLGYDGDVYDAIKAADPFACLESCSVIYELFHHVSAPSVSKNWSISNSMSFQLGPNIREFTKNVPLLAAKLDVDGRSLPRERPGPLPAYILQVVIDTIRATGTSNFDIDIAKGQAILDGPAAFMTQIKKFFKLLDLILLPPTSFLLLP
jgi:hypothetical protein